MKERNVRMEKGRPLVVKTASGTPVLEVTVQGSRTVVVKQINWRVPVIFGG